MVKPRASSSVSGLFSSRILGLAPCVCVCVWVCVCVCVILGLAARFASGWRPLTPEVVNEILNDFLPCPVAFSDMA